MEQARFGIDKRWRAEWTSFGAMVRLVLSAIHALLVVCSGAACAIIADRDRDLERKMRIVFFSLHRPRCPLFSPVFIHFLVLAFHRLMRDLSVIIFIIISSLPLPQFFPSHYPKITPSSRPEITLQLPFTPTLTLPMLRYPHSCHHGGVLFRFI